MSDANSYWYCPTCDEKLDGEAVTFEELHDPKYGGCGFKVESRSRTPNRPPSCDTPKPPMVVYGRRLHPSTDLDGNIISENWMATTSDHPLMKGETYIHLDQFLAEVERRAMEIGYNVTEPSFEQVGEAMLELAKEIKEGKA